MKSWSVFFPLFLVYLIIYPGDIIGFSRVPPPARRHTKKNPNTSRRSTAQQLRKLGNFQLHGQKTGRVLDHT